MDPTHQGSGTNRTNAQGSYFAVPGAVESNNAAFDQDQVAPAPLSSLPSLPSLATPITENTPTANNAPSTAARHVRFRPSDRQSSVIRLRRLRNPSLPPKPASAVPASASGPLPRTHDASTETRRRSSSDPQHSATNYPAPAVMKSLPAVPEGALKYDPREAQPVELVDTRTGGRTRFLRRRRHPAMDQPPTATVEDCYDSRIVDFLDVIDPEVATLSSITNIQNSLFVPSLGKWINRRPTYNLSRLPPMPGAFPASREDVGVIPDLTQEQRPTPPRIPSLSSVLTAPQYAVLPDDATLEGWGEEDIKLLNDYVRHMLHSRRSKIKQRFKAFGQYTKRPLGFFVTLYATLITLFGLAWVLFLIGWIYVGEKQLYVINVIDYVLVALFAIVGDGMAPFRAKDTYHMIYVAHYHRKTWQLRQKLLLPNLKDHNDLPTASQNNSTIDLEAGPSSEEKDDFIPVLDDDEQAKLVHHQAKLAKSHTFYKPHETETHHAFPLRLLITVVCLLDLHSCLQIALGACTWGIDYAVRPAVLTTTILCCSIATNAAAGIFISIGDRRTRKKDVLERLWKQELTGEVMGKMKKEKEKEEKGEDKGLVLAPL
ncbi:hypothetical protein B0H67DRAFT_601667 [Lasiosphaeris hirsuta]|uniref:Integral membrane protein n=1 Tax=Lasiosphaeris hirsuta TaxID=260670 RepID=A0AA40DSW5_9PEZI|nr:hypothetical protein B0H67DRAFT_601667 [Lasiosphaeris hirsuta]